MPSLNALIFSKFDRWTSEGLKVADAIEVQGQRPVKQVVLQNYASLARQGMQSGSLAPCVRVIASHYGLEESLLESLVDNAVEHKILVPDAVDIARSLDYNRNNDEGYLLPCVMVAYQSVAADVLCSDEPVQARLAKVESALAFAEANGMGGVFLDEQIKKKVACGIVSTPLIALARMCGKLESVQELYRPLLAGMVQDDSKRSYALAGAGQLGMLSEYKSIL